jgi:hypothetical protein
MEVPLKTKSLAINFSHFNITYVLNEPKHLPKFNHASSPQEMSNKVMYCPREQTSMNFKSPTTGPLGNFEKLAKRALVWSSRCSVVWVPDNYFI